MVAKGVGADSALKTKAIATVQAGLRLDGWARILLANFTATVRDRYHDIRLRNRQHMYLVLSAPTSGTGSYSASQKNAYLDALVMGPTNHTVANTGDAALRAAVLGVLKDARSLPSPTQPSHWVNPATGARTTLQAMNTLSGAIPDAVVLEGDGWVRALNI